MTSHKTSFSLTTTKQKNILSIHSPTKPTTGTQSSKFDKYQNYLNLALGVLLVGMIGKNVLPNFNPIDILPRFGDTSGPIVGSSSNPTIDLKIVLTTLIDNKFLQSSMKSAPGTAVVTDMNLNILAGKGVDTPMEPASISKVITAYAFIKEFGLDAKVPGFGDKSVKTLVQGMLDLSDNVLAEQMANKVGIEKVQALTRQEAGNPNLVVGNGSGCNQGGVGDATHGCTNYGSTPTTKVSVNDMAKITASFDRFLISKGSSLIDIMGTVNTAGASGRRFQEYFIGVTNPQVALKTGTLNSNPMFSAAGVMVNPNGEKLYYAMVTPGPHSIVADKQANMLRSFYQGNANHKLK